MKERQSNIPQLKRGAVGDCINNYVVSVCVCVYTYTA